MHQRARSLASRASRGLIHRARSSRHVSSSSADISSLSSVPSTSCATKHAAFKPNSSYPLFPFLQSARAFASIPRADRNLFCQNIAKQHHKQHTRNNATTLKRYATSSATTTTTTTTQTGSRSSSLLASSRAARRFFSTKGDPANPTPAAAASSSSGALTKFIPRPSSLVIWRKSDTSNALPPLKKPLGIFGYAWRLGLAGAICVLGAVLAAIPNVSLHGFLSREVKQTLHGQSISVLCGAIEEMAELGLFEMKLVPSSVVEQMADESKLEYNTDPTVIIEKPEIGLFINSSRIFKDLHMRSSDALPNNFDCIVQPLVPGPFAIREQLRNQFLDLVTGVFTAATHTSGSIWQHASMLQMMLQQYFTLAQTQPWVVEMTTFMDRSPFVSLDHSLDVMLLSDNGLSDAYHIAIKGSSSDMLASGLARPEAAVIGANVQHAMLNNHHQYGKLLNRIDDRFIHQVILPDENDEYIKNHPFAEELLAIPQWIKDHPDKTVTGPLFEYYYNVLSRNPYHNAMIDQMGMLMSLRDMLHSFAEQMPIIQPECRVDGSNIDYLTHPSLQPYCEVLQQTLDRRVTQVGIQTPLALQPFHFFTSTGRTPSEVISDMHIPTQFLDIEPEIDPFSTRLFDEYEPATPIERYIVTPRLPADMDHIIQTGSVFTPLMEPNVPNADIIAIHELPCRYTVAGSENHPDVIALSRVLHKIDIAILRYQLEIDRVHKQAELLNPQFHAQIKPLVEQLQPKQTASTNASPNRPWWQFW